MEKLEERREEKKVWYDDDGICLVCGMARNPKDPVFCPACKVMFEDFIIMCCTNCGNNVATFKTENCRPKLDKYRKEGRAVYDIGKTTVVLYGGCPKCRRDA